MIEFHVTQRLFVYGEFTDLYNEKCTIQESSLADINAIWLGTQNHRMHLDQAMAAELIPYLQYFVEHGRLPDPNESTEQASEEQP